MKKILLFGLILLTAAVSCNKWEEPDPYTPAEMTPTMTIAQFKALYKGTPLEITDSELIIGGKVVSSDQSGNFYRSFYIQDETGGIEIKVGKTGLYNDYKEGMMVYVQPKYLCLGAYGGMVQLGAVSAEAKYETAYIDVQELINRTVFRGEIGEKVTPLEISTTSGISSSNLGKLVKIMNVRYSGGDSGLTTWATRADSDKGISAASGNQNFYMGTRKLVVRTSGYANFASEPCPAVGSMCNITAVLTLYNTTYQLIILDVTGVEVLE